MKQVKLVGLSLLAIFALGAFTAVSASAEEGFLTGNNMAPTLANILGAESKLETEGGGTIKCEKLDETHFKFENAKHATVTLHWLGCKAEGLFATNSLGDKSGEILVPVLFLVCLDPKDKEGKLIDEYGIAGEVVGVAHLEVPSVGTLIEVKGTALGAVLTKGKATLFSVEFLGSKGKQTVTECLEGTIKKVHNLLSSTNHGTFKPASENVVGGLVQFDETVELMDS